MTNTVKFVNHQQTYFLKINIMKKTCFLTLLLIVCYSCTSDSNIVVKDPNTITDLTFEEAYTFESNLLGGPFMGMTNSKSENSLYISCRENESSSTTTEEEVFKLNLDTNELLRKNVSPGGFITKQLTIFNNELLSIGGTELKTYDLDLLNEPSSRSYYDINGNSPYFTLSKYGIARDSSDIYIIGGYRVDLSNKENKKIYKFNVNSGELFDDSFDTPETMMGASGAVANNKLYVFGGALYKDFIVGTNRIYVYPLDNPDNYEAFSMPVTADITFVQKYGDHIMVAGHKGLYEGLKTSFIGRFDTVTDTFEEITTNLDSEGGLKAIHQMTIKNDVMYVLFGHVKNNLEQLPASNWKVLTVNLNQ
jgi:hypothetical protein